MSKKKAKQEKFTTFAPFSKISYFITDNGDSDKITLRIDEGSQKGIIVEIKNFRFEDEVSSIMTFDLDTIHVPDDVKQEDAELEVIVKKAVKKIIETAVKNNMLNEEQSNFVHIDK
jgi:hypothetical protein